MISEPEKIMEEAELPAALPVEVPIPHTEFELAPEEPGELGGSEEIPETSEPSNEFEETEPEVSGGSEEIPKESAFSTEFEKTEPKVRRRRKASAPKSNRSDTEPTLPSEDAVGAEESLPKGRSVKPRSAVVTIDDARSVQTEADKEESDLLDLLESLRTGRILSGTIQGVERGSDREAGSFAVIYHGSYKIMIPAEAAVDPPEDYRDQEPEDVHHYLLTKRLGAEVDYIIKGVDAEEKLAVASRLDAMKAKRKHYYFGADRDGREFLYPGVCAEARVVSVIRAGIFVDLCGLEVYIPLRELSYQRMMDAAGAFSPGQRILVKILSIDRSDRQDIKVRASVKEAGENPYEKALARYTVGNRYVGSVSMVDTNGVFVALDGGIDCLCSYPKRGRPPRGSRVTVRILGINHETNRIWGAITHIATPR